MKDENYVGRLENVIKQMLTPLKNIPFNLVIECLAGKKVISFDSKNNEDMQLLGILKEVAIVGGKKINKNGIRSRRPNEVGNYIEAFVKEAMQQYSLNPDTPAGTTGKKKAAGYPDIIFSFKNTAYRV